MSPHRARRPGAAFCLLTLGFAAGCATTGAAGSIAGAGAGTSSPGARVMPPWERSPSGGRVFQVPDIDNVPDLYGDAQDAQLVVFFAGNQFMVVPDLLDAFRAGHPEVQRIFVETLPPGILLSQMQQGALIIGNLRLTARPDVFAAGKGRIDQLAREGKFSDTASYASNRLAIMVRAGNPLGVRTVSDLGRPDVRVSMPNPAWEGVARQIESVYRKAGGAALDSTIMHTKVANGTTTLTQIHHRQTPIRILEGRADAGPVWYTEAYFQRMIGNPIDLVEIPDAINFHVVYAAGSLRDAPHPEAARAFVEFLRTPRARAVYTKYGFLPPR